MVPRSEVVANLTAPVKWLFELVQNGILETILTGKPRVEAIEHRQQHRLSPADIERLKVRYSEIKSMRQVAREFGISRTTVRSHLRSMGVTVRVSKPMSEQEKQKAREMWAAGMTSTQIGQKLGLSHHTILRAVRST